MMRAGARGEALLPGVLGHRASLGPQRFGASMVVRRTLGTVDKEVNDGVQSRDARDELRREREALVPLVEKEPIAKLHDISRGEPCPKLLIGTDCL